MPMSVLFISAACLVNTAIPQFANVGGKTKLHSEEPYNFNQTTAQCERIPCEGCYFPLPEYAECNNTDDKFGHPTDCTKYFQCVLNEEKCKQAEWGRIDKKCAEGTFFDPIDKECVTASECPQVCPQKLEDQEICKAEGDFVDDVNCAYKAICVLVPTCAEEGFKQYWTAVCAACVCKEVSQTFGYASSCREYVSCAQAPNKTWYWEKNKCDLGILYNQSSGMCSSDPEGTCLYCAEPVTEELNEQCTENGLTLPHPNGCKLYIICKEETRPECNGTYMGYDIGNCGEMFYDQNIGRCVLTFTCPTDPTITNPCIRDGATFPVEGSCTKYKVCKDPQNTGSGEWEEAECPTNQHYDILLRKCDDGPCPCSGAAPEYAQCEENGEGHIFGDTKDCTKYFLCKRNGDSCGGVKWGKVEKKCPQGKFFDGKNSCVESDECAHICLPKADESLNCTTDGQIILDSDCRTVTVCKRVTCEQNNFEHYWSTEVVTCSPDKNYNAALRKCVKTAVCPQGFEDENCPGAKWEHKGKAGYLMRYAYHGNGDSICRAMIDSTTLSAGVFNNETQNCYVPPKPEDDWEVEWFQRDEYELLSPASTGLYLTRRWTEEKNFPEFSFRLTPSTYAVVCFSSGYIGNVGIMRVDGTIALTYIPGSHQEGRRCKIENGIGESFQYYLACKPA